MVQIVQSSKNKETITIDDLCVWAIRDQCADRYSGTYGTHMSATAVALEIAKVGCRVDGHGPTLYSKTPHDADQVALAISHLPAKQAGLVFRHARTGTRPDWLSSSDIRMRPVRDERGRIAVWWRRKGREVYGHASDNSVATDRHVVMAEVTPMPDPQTVALVQQQFDLWYDGLRQLITLLAQPSLALIDHQPVMPPRPHAAA